MNFFKDLLRKTEFFTMREAWRQDTLDMCRLQRDMVMSEVRPELSHLSLLFRIVSSMSKVCQSLSCM